MSKTSPRENLSCENKLDLHAKEPVEGKHIHFTCKRFFTKTRFDAKVQGISEMVYSLSCSVTRISNICRIQKTCEKPDVHLLSSVLSLLLKFHVFLFYPLGYSKTGRLQIRPPAVQSD